MMKLWTVKITTLLLWAFAAGSAAFWVLQNTQASSADAQSAAKSVAAFSPQPADNATLQMAMALGAKNPVVPTAASVLAALQARLQLQGIVAVGGAASNQSSAALISVDGKPAKPYRTGAAIEDGLEVTSIKAYSVAIGSNGAQAFSLELPRRDPNLGLKK
jgi:general secretion pathway protein C